MGSFPTRYKTPYFVTRESTIFLVFKLWLFVNCSSGHSHANKNPFPIGNVAVSPEDINLFYLIVEFLSIDGDSLKSIGTKIVTKPQCPLSIYHI